jgi:hypothetical protein
MEVLFAFLNWVSSFHTIDEETGSKMDIHNLATVIAPNILYSNPKGQEQKFTDVDSSFLAIEAVRAILECNDEMCEVSRRIERSLSLERKLIALKVPSDLVSILNDPTLFDEDRTDITTKEILKRYGQISKQQPQMAVANPPTPGHARDGRSNAPVITRAETDPGAWGHSAYAGGYGTPSQSNHEFQPPNQPYAHSAGTRSNDSRNNSPNRHSQYRSPMPSKQGQMGVTGAG